MLINKPLKPVFIKVSINFKIPLTEDFQVSHNLCEDNIPELMAYSAEADLRRSLTACPNQSSISKTTYL